MFKTGGWDVAQPQQAVAVTKNRPLAVTPSALPQRATVVERQPFHLAFSFFEVIPPAPSMVTRGAWALPDNSGPAASGHPPVAGDLFSSNGPAMADIGCQSDTEAHLLRRAPFLYDWKRGRANGMYPPTATTPPGSEARDRSMVLLGDPASPCPTANPHTHNYQQGLYT